MACHAHTHKISGRGHNNMALRPMKDPDLGHTCLKKQLAEIFLKKQCPKIVTRREGTRKTLE